MSFIGFQFDVVCFKSSYFAWCLSEKLRKQQKTLEIHSNTPQRNSISYNEIPILQVEMKGN